MCVKITDENLTQLYGKKVCEAELHVDGFKKPMKFDVYDGFAICPKYGKKQYEMTYPTLSFVKGAKELADEVMAYKNLKNANEITVIHILETYNTLTSYGRPIVKE